MSRGQQADLISTAKDQNKTDFGNAQSAYKDTQTNIGDYKDQLAKFVSDNPYTSGGQYDKTIGTGLANVSDSGANSLHGALQAQALRTGQNSAAGLATAASAAQQNTRDLGTAMASAQQDRIGKNAAYGQTALGATTEPINAEQNLYGTSSGAAGGALNTQEGASQTPGFWDTVGNAWGGTIGRTLGGGNKG